MRHNLFLKKVNFDCIQNGMGNILKLTTKEFLFFLKTIMDIKRKFSNTSIKESPPLTFKKRKINKEKKPCADIELAT